MLVLQRTQSQAIILDGGIRIVVVAIRGKYVQIGIEAPKSVNVRREEVPDNRERSKA